MKQRARGLKTLKLVTGFGLFLLLLACSAAAKPVTMVETVVVEAPAAAPEFLSPKEPGTPIPVTTTSIDPSNASQVALLAEWGLAGSQTGTQEQDPLYTATNSLAFTPDGTQLVLGTQNGSVELLWFSDGSLVEVFGAAGTPVNEVAVSPDGGVIAAGLQNGAVQLWSLNTNSLVNELSGLTQEVSGLAFSPDGSYLAGSSEDGGVVVWSMVDGNVAARLEGSPGLGASGVSFSSFGGAGEYLLATLLENGVLHFWNTADWSQVGEIMTNTPGNEVTFLPELPLQALVSSTRGEQTLWFVGDGSMVGGFRPSPTGILDMALAPSGLIAANGSYNGIELTDFRRMVSLPLFTDKETPVTAVAFSPGGNYLVSVSRDGAVRIWGVAAQ